MSKKKDKSIRDVPSGSNWSDVLNEIYQKSPHLHGDSVQLPFSDDKHHLAQKLKISGKELEAAISFLQDQKLVEKILPNDNNFQDFGLLLTTKGFDVARDNIKHKNSFSLQMGLLLFTAILALNGVFQILLPMGKNKTILLTIYLISLVGIYIIGNLIFKRI
ncbi:MAG: hypothetical protein ACFFG0_55430 [Candidatus Thorarchaeota archaeon]